MKNRVRLAVMLAIVGLAPMPGATQPTAMAGQAATSKARILVHVTHGPSSRPGCAGVSRGQERARRGTYRLAFSGR